MVTLIIVLTILTVILTIMLLVSLRTKSKKFDDDHSFRDQNGDHIYYDMSIIEKKKFNHLHPKQAARTFSRLFSRK